MKNKTLVFVAFATIFIFISVSFVSANVFGDFWNKFTGKVIDAPQHQSFQGLPLCNTESTAVQYCKENGYDTGKAGVAYSGGQCAEYKDGEWLLYQSNSVMDAKCFNTESNNTKSNMTESDIISHWTQWYNIDSPSGSGDWELLSSLGDVCNGQKIVDVECQTASGVDSSKTGQNISCSTTRGFYCQNKDNPSGCLNYQVRFYCQEKINESNPLSNQIIQYGTYTVHTGDTINFNGVYNLISVLQYSQCLDNLCSTTVNKQVVRFQDISSGFGAFEEFEIGESGNLIIANHTVTYTGDSLVNVKVNNISIVNNGHEYSEKNNSNFADITLSKSKLFACGNGVQDVGEQCDGNQWAYGATCGYFGYSSGNLSCKNDCTFDFSGCLGINSSTHSYIYPSPFVENGIPDVRIAYGTAPGASTLEQFEAGEIELNLRNYVSSSNISENWIVKDSEVFKINKNLILLGTKDLCTNSASLYVLSVLNNESTNITSCDKVFPHVLEGGWEIRSVGNSFARSPNKIALIVEGYSISDLLNAVNYLTHNKIDVSIGRSYYGTSAKVSSSITSPGIYTVKQGTTFDINNIAGSINNISWAYSGDTEPKVWFSGPNAQSLLLHSGEEGRLFSGEVPINTFYPEDSLLVKVVSIDKNSLTAEVVFDVMKRNVSEGSVSNSCSEGCSLDGKCVSVGYRNKGTYCSPSGEFSAQLEAGISCDNNFECGSNVCANNKCVSGSLIQSIIDWLSRLFGGS